MGKFFIGTIVGTVVVSVCWIIFWAGQLGNPHPNNTWIEEAIDFKHLLADAQPSPRILVVAGSAAMFGVKSQYLENTYRRPTINLGVNAGISLPAILHRAESTIQAGDLVLLPLEYPLYNKEEAVSSSLIHWANSHPETFLQLPPRRALEVFIKTSYTRILEGYRGIPSDFTVSGDYGVHNLDTYGDQLHTTIAQREPRHWSFLNSLPAEAYGEALSKGSYDWVRLQHFRDSVLARDACPVFVPPPLLFKDVYLESQVEADFYQTLPDKATQEGLYWLGHPLDTMYEAEAFFDTNFHLVDEARLEYTQQLVNWLGSQPFIDCKAFYEALGNRQ